MLAQFPQASLIGESGGLCQVLGGLHQSAIEALVSEINLGKLLAHPFHRLRARLDKGLCFRVLDSRSLRHAVPPLSRIAMSVRLANRLGCVQPFPRTEDVPPNSVTKAQLCV